MKLVLLNIQSGRATTRGYWEYFRRRRKTRTLGRIAEFLRTEGAALAALCEIDAGSARTGGIDQVSYLSSHTSLVHHAFFPTFVVGELANQGNSLHSLFPIVGTRNHLLPGIGEPRYLSEARVRMEGEEFTVFVTHLSLRLHVRRSQLEAIRDRINEMRGPVILAGDFNVALEDELEFLETTRLSRVVSGRTFPSWKPRKALDHVFFSDDFSVRESHVHDQDLFSDHLPLVVEFSWR